MTALLASTVLDRAADQIAKTGLWKGAYCDGEWTDDDRYCMLGAVYHALGDRGIFSNQKRVAVSLIEDLMDLDDGDLILWSDAPSTTAEMVVDVLRHAASVARLDEEAAA